MAETGDRVAVLALDRWGRVLLVNGPEGFAPPAGPLVPGEVPDEAALRVVEEAFEWVLDDLRLFAVRATPGLRQHAYYCDPDIPASTDASTQRYLGPGELGALSLAAGVADLLSDFFASAAYRAMFH